MQRELIKQAKAVLRRFGVQLKDYKWTRRHFERLGIETQTIIDVGVMHGTPELYSIFPEAHYVLVEPQRDYQRNLVHEPRSYEWRNVALGSSNGCAELNVNGGMSSLFAASPARELPVHDRYSVPLTTLDDLIASIGRAPKYGLKIDVEGYELEVLKGLSSNAAKLEFVLIEVAIQDMYKERAQCSEIFHRLGQLQFELVDVLNLPNDVPAIMDMLFLPRDHIGFSRARNFKRARQTSGTPA